MAEETYLIAKAVLRNFKHRPTSPQDSFLSNSTISACARATQSLAHLTITVEENELIGQANSIEAIEQFLSEYIKEIDKAQRHSKAWKKAYAFTQFAGPVLEVFKQANFTPECSIALGLVGLLLIQPLNNKSEIEERLELEIGQLKDIISQVKFSNSMIQTPDINSEVQGLCAAIIDFLVHALHYQKKWGIVKVLGGIIADFAKRFQAYVKKIKGHALKIETLAQRGYTTILVQSKEVLDGTAQAITELQSRMIAQASANAFAFARLEDNLERCKSSINDVAQIEAIKYTHQIAKILSYKRIDQGKGRLLIHKQAKELAPREKWENNVSEIQAPGWLGRNPRPILWIGGRQNKKEVSWVSSFALDFIEAVEMERATGIAYVLCNKGSDEEPPTPVHIFTETILQLLKVHADILAVPKNLEQLSLQRFEDVGDSPETAFQILVDILRMVNEKCQRENTEMVLLIDRVDVTLSKQSSVVKQRFLRALQQLIREFETFHIILTGQYRAQEVNTFLDGKDKMMEIWVDTTTPLPMYSRR